MKADRVGHAGKVPSDDICVRVGRRIRVIRDERGYTQAQLADFALLAREHLSELENGRKEVGIRTLERLVEALGSTFSDFFREI